MRMWQGLYAVAALAALTQGCGTDDATLTDPAISTAIGRSEFRVFTATGDLAATLQEFRDAFGTPAAGNLRQIRWDGVPAALTNVDNFPADFFKTAGAIFATEGTGFRNADDDFAGIDPSYGDEFAAFSNPKTFMPIGSEKMDVLFTVPGTTTPATTRGFGVVFSDVERQGAASIKLFDKDGRSLGQRHAPPASDAAGFSFVGMIFEDPIVARVEITSGQAGLGAGVFDLSDGGNRDLAIMDDYIFGEPRGIE